METLETYSVTIVTSVTWDMEWVLHRRRLYGKILFPLQLKPFIITQCNCTSIGLCNTKKTWLFPSGGRGSGVAGIGLAVCWVSTGLGQLEAAEELVRLGRKCCNRLRQLLSLREAFRKALHSWSKQAAWRNWSVEEGNFVCLCLSSPSLWARGGALTLSGWTSHINQLAAAELHSLWRQSPPEWAGAYVYIMWAFAKAPQIFSPSATTTWSSLYETLSLCCWTSHRSGSRPHSAPGTCKEKAAGQRISEPGDEWAYAGCTRAYLTLSPQRAFTRSLHPPGPASLNWQIHGQSCGSRAPPVVEPDGDEGCR